jgi:hypothetical protein
MHTAVLDAFSTVDPDTTCTEHPAIAGWTCALYPRLRSSYLRNQGTVRGFQRGDKRHLMQFLDKSQWALAALKNVANVLR